MGFTWASEPAFITQRSQGFLVITHPDIKGIFFIDLHVRTRHLLHEFGA